MSEKFTKGPWLLGFLDNRTRIVVESEESRYCVADIIDVSGVDLSNAALIAAAPEMYDLLEKISIAMERFHGVDTDEINKLLAKARGEA